MFHKSFRITMDFSSYIHTQIVRKLQESTKVFPDNSSFVLTSLRYMSSNFICGKEKIHASNRSLYTLSDVISFMAFIALRVVCSSSAHLPFFHTENKEWRPKETSYFYFESII